VVLSGINLGPNIGNGMWHSGTLAAAKQASLLGIKGIALSTPVNDTEPDFDLLAPWVERVLEILLPDDSLELVNVNFPPDPKGMCWTCQSVRHYDGIVIPSQDPHGRQIYWLTVEPIEHTEEGTDRWAMENDYVSVTPLRLDLTNRTALEQSQQRQPLDWP
jgi:5'-nucleotidase